VPISHASLAAFCAAIPEAVPSGPQSRVLSAASPLFDAIFMDIAASLAQGGLMIRIPARAIGDGRTLERAVAAHAPTYLDLTPTVWRAVLATGWTPPDGFTAVTGGEAMGCRPGPCPLAPPCQAPKC